MPDVKSLERNARALLGQLRSGTYDSGEIRDKLGQSLTRAKLSYADIGTSEEELKALRPQGEFYEAKRRLELLRRGSGNFTSHLTRLRQSLQACGKNLEDIGSSEEELHRLRS